MYRSYELRLIVTVGWEGKGGSTGAGVQVVASKRRASWSPSRLATPEFVVTSSFSSRALSRLESSRECFNGVFQRGLAASDKADVVGSEPGLSAPSPELVPPVAFSLPRSAHTHSARPVPMTQIRPAEQVDHPSEVKDYKYPALDSLPVLKNDQIGRASCRERVS